MNLIRLYAGEILLRAAALCAKAGRSLSGSVPVAHVVKAEAGSADVELAEQLPAGILRPRGLTFSDDDSREIVEVESTRGKRARLRRKLAKSYAAGSPVRVLM